jgi:hypothetical protein
MAKPLLYAIPSPLNGERARVRGGNVLDAPPNTTAQVSSRIRARAARLHGSPRFAESACRAEAQRRPTEQNGEWCQAEVRPGVRCFVPHTLLVMTEPHAAFETKHSCRTASQHPERMPEISRGLSAATPPERKTKPPRPCKGRRSGQRYLTTAKRTCLKMAEMPFKFAVRRVSRLDHPGRGAPISYYTATNTVLPSPRKSVG